MAGVAGPVLGMLEDVEEMPLRHARADFLLELRQPFRVARSSPIASGAACRRDRCSIRRWPGNRHQPAAASFVNSAFSAAAKSSPRSGMPRAAQ